MYMETAHPHIKDILAKFWLSNALDMSPFETLSIIDWIHTYNKLLKQFGISDDQIDNGYLGLCNAYARKIHSQIIPFII